MKKAVFLLLILLLSIGSNAQSKRHNSRELNKELKTYLSTKNTSNVKLRHTNSFKTPKFPLEQTHYDWDGNQWEFAYNSDITYHPDGRKKYDLLKDQFNDVFTTVWYTYDVQNRITEVYAEVLTFTGWEPMLQTIYEYNA